MARPPRRSQDRERRSGGSRRVVARMRTVVVTLSPLLGEMLTQALAASLALAPFTILRTRTRLATRLRALAPDVVLLGLRPRETAGLAQALAESLPQTRILAFAADGRLASLHVAGHSAQPVNDLSLRGIAAILAMPPQAKDEISARRI
jgi:hypothetical protein